MSSNERGRWFRRGDVRTGFQVGLVLVLSVLVLAIASFSHAAMESLEEADRWFEFTQRIVLHELGEWDSPAEAIQAISVLLPNHDAAIRIRDEDGRVVAERGAWPPPEKSIPTIAPGSQGHRRDLDAFRNLGSDLWLVGTTRNAKGEVFELALPLQHFADEAGEQLKVIAAVGGVASLLVLIVGMGSVGMAFAPLRRARNLLEEADEGNPGLRLPSRNTGDPIDAHAEALNRVLERIDSALIRSRTFSTNVAHELSNPLNRISNVTEVALLDDDPAELRRALETVQSTTDQLERVVRSLFLLAELDDRRLVLHPESIDLTTWIANHVEIFDPAFESAGIKLVADIEPGVIQADRTLLDRIVANLLDNALIHAPAGTEVAIRSRCSNGRLSLCVDDAGPGVPESERERIFDRFERLGNDRHPGHGLGLALARAIAEFHGGTLQVHRSWAGGARFEFSLPIDGATR